jgi:hypothetical protein
MLESISDLKMWLWYSDPGGQNTVRLLTIAAQYKFKKSSYKQIFCRDSHGEHKVPVNVPILIVKCVVLTRLQIYYCWTTLVVLKVNG